MVEHDKYILLTSSRAIVERFLEISDGKPCLADSPHFRFARLLSPLQNEYTLFAYFSPDFFKALVSPAYQIELKRRLAAISNIEMAEMAQLVAKAEGVDATNIDQLVLNGYLPEMVPSATRWRSDTLEWDTMDRFSERSSR